MSKTQVKLWGTTTSRTMRPIWMAEELGLTYDLTPMGPRTGETQTAAYTKMNPKQIVPFMKDGEVALAESIAISRYLSEAYPASQVYVPQDLATRALLDDWVCYVYGELDETSLYVMRRHGDLAPIYGGSQEVVDSAAAYANRHLAVIEQKMVGRDFVMPGGFSLADIVLGTCVDWAVVYGLTLPQGLANYRERLNARPAYQKAYDINFKTEQ